jgi:hypothetical protein
LPEDFWYHRISNVTGGWTMSSLNDSIISCMMQFTVYSSYDCFADKYFKSQPDKKVFWGSSETLYARNIIIERSVKPHEPLTCP